MSTASTTTTQIARHKQRVQVLLPAVLVAALDEYARRMLVDRTAGIHAAVLDILPADLREFVETESGSRLSTGEAVEALAAYLQQRS